MYKRIIVPIDNTEVSLLPLQHAAELAKDQGAELRVLHAVITAPWGLGEEYSVHGPEVRASIIKAGEKVLAQAVARVRKVHDKVDTKLLEVASLDERLPSLILTEANDWGADLIVMGSHVRRGLKHLLMGSVAEALMRSASVPVLLVHSKAEASASQGPL
jgi:nucleotide-binding universal stress UspA family protein